MYNHHQQRSVSGRYGGGGASGSSGSSSGRRTTNNPPVGALNAWADWAARNLDVDIGTTPLQAYVERCCDPIMGSPNLALNLELADYINQKKANTPREAAVEVVRKVNSRNPHVAMLALHLLDNLVKNCGYPFHLQIATKEFLNELVKRFPERPPVFPSPTQGKILELIHEWKMTICVTSKHKGDLVHIRDMHRLLTYKGYRFPNIDLRAADVMNPQNSLRSPEELEEEDRAAQAAKLQELIRRGTPRDLQQAQELMVIMSGAEPESKPDYAEQTRKELDKVQSRAILLNDMLNNAKEGEKFAQGDAYDQISAHLKTAQTRIQKWISEAEEGGESDQMDRLLLMNDLINQVCDRHAAFKKGDFSATANIDPSIDPRKNGSAAVPTAKISDLISFDDEQPAASAAPAAGAAASESVLDDFASLSFGPSSSNGQGNASQSNGGDLPADLFASSSSTSPPAQSAAATSGPTTWGALQLPFASSSSPAPGTPPNAASNGLPSTTPLQPQQRGVSGVAPLVPNSLGQSSSRSATPQGQQAQTMAQAQQAQAKKDPFADLDAMFG